MKRHARELSDVAAGFTLLELLVATAVGGVVLLVIQTTFFGALRLHNTTHARLDESLELQRALAIVRQDFAGLRLPGGSLAGELQSTTFSSSLTDEIGERVSPDLFTTSGRVDGWNPFSEAQRVAYFLAPATNGGRGKDLVRAVTRNLLPVQEEAGDPQVLLHGVAEATIEFFDGTGWIDTWDSEATSTLPTGLKLRLVFEPRENERTSPEPIEVVVPVFVATSASANAAAQAAAAAGELAP